MPEKIVIVARFSVPTEAALAKNKLEAEGIAAYLEGEFSSGILAGMVDGYGGIKLHVAESNVERAREILDGFEDEMTMTISIMRPRKMVLPRQVSRQPRVSRYP